MKLSSKLCGAALLAVLGLATAIPNAVQAEGEGVKDLSGGAEIEFTSTVTEPTTETIPTSAGSATGSGYLPTETAGSGYTTTDAKGFGISFITGLDFGKHAATADGTGTWWANNWKEGDVETANFVNFEDKRTTDDHSYKITAQLTQQFKGALGSSEVTLNGASITYNNGDVFARNGSNNANNPSDGIPASTTVTTEGTALMLDNTKPIDHAANTVYEKGYGQWMLLYGKYSSDETEAGSSLRSISLNVPSTNTSIHNVKYNAVVKWTMSEVK